MNMANEHLNMTHGVTEGPFRALVALNLIHLGTRYTVRYDKENGG